MLKFIMLIFLLQNCALVSKNHEVHLAAQDLESHGVVLFEIIPSKIEMGVTPGITIHEIGGDFKLKLSGQKIFAIKLKPGRYYLSQIGTVVPMDPENGHRIEFEIQFAKVNYIGSYLQVLTDSDLVKLKKISTLGRVGRRYNYVEFNSSLAGGFKKLNTRLWVFYKVDNNEEVIEKLKEEHPSYQPIRVNNIF